jgi:hypothetical protein
MRAGIAAEHAGFALKEQSTKALLEAGHATAIASSK